MFLDQSNLIYATYFLVWVIRHHESYFLKN